MCFVLVGCGQTDDKEKGNNTAKQNETEVNTNENNKTETQDNNDQNEAPDIELYSDDTKIVFKNEQGRVVYYYSGKQITGQRLYVDYGTPKDANVALSILNYEENETIDSAHVEGKYLVIVYNKSTYESFDVDTLRLVYSYLEELKKEN
jgi:hypothetical protein